MERVGFQKKQMKRLKMKQNKTKNEIELEKLEKKEDKLFEKEKKIEVLPYQTFKISDLANMFPFNITPALNESKIAHAVAAKQRMFNSMNPQMAMMIITILMGGVIAAVIAWKFIGGGDGSQEVKVVLDSGLVLAQNTNMTG